MTEYTSLDVDEYIRIGDEVYSIIEVDGELPLQIQLLETEYCDRCEDETVDNPCDQCGHNKLTPTIGGYDPELDTDG
jgi:formylmethanofuran dehydrogenase subunit E